MITAVWFVVGTFILGVLVLLGVPTGPVVLGLMGLCTFGPLMWALDEDRRWPWEDDEEDDDDDDGWGNLYRDPNPDEPWWPSGVCPDNDLAGV